MSDKGSVGDLSAITCAFCVGDPNRIATAFLGHYKRAFRTGSVADRFVELPVGYADVIIHLADAVVDVVGCPRPSPLRPTPLAGDEDSGMWVEVLPEAWVRLISGLETDQLSSVAAKWARRLSAEGYDPDPGTWESPGLTASLQHLVEIAKESLSTGKPLLGLSAI